MYKKQYKPEPKILANNRIRAKEVRLIDDDGSQLGVLPLEQALARAKEKNSDLIQVTEKVEPPVCKIMDFGKYLYSLKKKEKSVKQNKGGEMKGIRLTFNISDHDLETRAKQAEKFLKQGDRINLEMKLRGREKAHQNFAIEKINKFIEFINKTTPVKVERDIKKQPRGLTMIIAKK
jgi:translation initiation factor IF-3